MRKGICRAAPGSGGSGAQKCYKPGHTLASTVLKCSVAAGSSWPEGGAKGKACTLKLNTRSPKLFKIFESGGKRLAGGSCWRSLLDPSPPNPP